VLLLLLVLLRPLLSAALFSSSFPSLPLCPRPSAVVLVALRSAFCSAALLCWIDAPRRRRYGMMDGLRGMRGDGADAV
jgi:hypothetical protein